jgi:hypothetical protein
MSAGRTPSPSTPSLGSPKYQTATAALRASLGPPMEADIPRPHPLPLPHIILYTRSVPPVLFFPPSFPLPSVFLGGSAPTGSSPTQHLLPKCSSSSVSITEVELHPPSSYWTMAKRILFLLPTLTPLPHLLSIPTAPHYLKLPKLQILFCCQAFVQAVPTARHISPSALLPGGQRRHRLL